MLGLFNKFTQLLLALPLLNVIKCCAKCIYFILNF